MVAGTSLAGTSVGCGASLAGTSVGGGASVPGSVTFGLALCAATSADAAHPASAATAIASPAARRTSGAGGTITAVTVAVRR